MKYGMRMMEEEIENGGVQHVLLLRSCGFPFNKAPSRVNASAPCSHVCSVAPTLVPPAS